MCFSAPASFVASGGLILLGAGTYAVAHKKDKILVAIPVLFGIQQFFEGIQWLSLNNGHTSAWAGYGFLFFALIVWPVYVPVFVYMLDKKRRNLLGVFVVLGVAVAVYFATALMTHDLVISERNSCVNYRLNLPPWWLSATPYLLAILGALFASSRSVFRSFGVVIAALAAVTWWVYKVNFISIWCFFSAAVSSLFFMHVQHRRSKARPKPAPHVA